MPDIKLTVPQVKALIQDVADSVEAILQAAVFPDRLIVPGQDGEAEPRVARYFLAMQQLCDAFGLDAVRKE